MPHMTTLLREAESPTDEVIEAAEQLHSDLIVVGHRGMSAIRQMLIGSVASRIVSHAPCSVWVVRQ